MRENPDGFLSSPGASRVAALIPVYRWDFTKKLKPCDVWSAEDKVAAGLNPAALATLATRLLVV
jgi:hypothetical protein